jgi:hypothetical protein
MDGNCGGLFTCVAAINRRMGVDTAPGLVFVCENMWLLITWVLFFTLN